MGKPQEENPVRSLDQAILEQKREAEMEEVNKTKKATVSNFVARSGLCMKRQAAGGVRMCSEGIVYMQW